MTPGVSDLLARWRAEPRPAVAISLCHALAEAGNPRPPTDETLGRPRTPPPAGYYDIVLDVGREAGTRYGDDAEVLLSIGRMYLATGKLVAEAQTIVVRAARLVPTDPRAFRLLGETLLRRGDAVRAVKAFERAIVGGMRDPATRAWHKRAQVYEPVQVDQGPAVVAARLAGDLGEMLDVGAPAGAGPTSERAERDRSGPISTTVVAPNPAVRGDTAQPGLGGDTPHPGAAGADASGDEPPPSSVGDPTLPKRSATDAAMAAARAGGPRPKRIRTATLMGMPKSPQQLSARRVIRPGDPELSSPPRMRVDDLQAYDEDEKTRVAQPKTKAGFAGAPADERAGAAAAAAAAIAQPSTDDSGPRSVVDLSEEDQATQITSMQNIITALEDMPPPPSYRTRMARDSDATQLRGREMLRSPTTEGVEDGRASQPNIWVPAEMAAAPAESPAAPAGAQPAPPYAPGEPVIGLQPGPFVDEPSSDATTRVLDRPFIPPELQRPPPADPPLTPKARAEGGVRPAPATPMRTLRIPEGQMPKPGMPPAPPRTPAPAVPAVPAPAPPVPSPAAPGTMPLTATLQSAAFSAPMPPSTASVPQVPVVEAPAPPSSSRPGMVPRPGRSAPVTGSMPAFVAADPFAKTHLQPARDSVVSLTSEAELVDDDGGASGSAPTARLGSSDVFEVDPDEIEDVPSLIEPGEDSDVVTLAQLRSREIRREAPAPPSRRSGGAGALRPPPDTSGGAGSESKAPPAAPGPPMQVTELFDEFGRADGEDEEGGEGEVRRAATGPRMSIADISSIRPLPPSSVDASPETEPRPMSVRPPPLVPSSPPRRRRSWFARTMVLSLFVGGAAAGALYYVQERRSVDPARGDALAAVAEEALRTGGPNGLASADKALQDARSLAPDSRAVAVANARARALRALDDTPSAQGPLREAIASARKLGAEADVAGAELALAAVSGDTPAADALMKQHDASHVADALYQLAAGAALEGRGDPAAAERYEAAAEGGWSAGNVRLARALLLADRRDAPRARDVAQRLDPARASVLGALANVIEGTAKAGAPVSTAEVADLPLPLRSIAWALSVLSRSEARGASSGLAAAIDDADTVAVAVFCGRVALAVADVEAATQALGRARKLSAHAPVADELERQLALLAGDLGKAAAAPGVARTVALLETASKPEEAAPLNAAIGEWFPGLREGPGMVVPLSNALRTKLENARVSRPLDLPWIELLLADAALDRGDLPAAKAILDRWTDPARHRLFAPRRARLLRYQGSVADARVALGEARESRRAWLERVLIDGEDESARDRALKEIGEPQDNEQRWAAGYVRVKAGDLAGASKALGKARLPTSPLPVRTLAALTLSELRDKRARTFVQALVTELPKNPDAQRAATLLGVTVK